MASTGKGSPLSRTVSRTSMFHSAECWTGVSSHRRPANAEVGYILARAGPEAGSRNERSQSNEREDMPTGC